LITPDHILSAADIGKLRAAGFAVVPREATKAVANAGYDRLDAGHSLWTIYATMIAAAEAELIHAHTTQALDHLAQIGVVPTMGADEVLKLTRD
jgi:1,2-phenylacetyl-CoA epoxidase PaaB subunit